MHCATTPWLFLANVIAGRAKIDNMSTEKVHNISKVECDKISFLIAYLFKRDIPEELVLRFGTLTKYKFTKSN